MECGLSSPDLSLIGPLTRLLHVSADELLGLTADRTDAYREELESRYQETWKTGDLAERYRIVCDAVGKYPGDMKYLDWLAWCEAMRSFDFKDDKEYAVEQEKAIKHFACVVENATDERIKASSIQGIVQYLSFRGRYDEAKKYAELYPEEYVVRKDQVLYDCLQGQEKIRHHQMMLDRMLIDILNHIGNNDLLACEAQGKILMAIIPDGNYFYYNCFLADNYRGRARLYIENGECSTAVECLEKSRAYATAYDRFIEENISGYYTSPFLNRLEYNLEYIVRTGTTSMEEDLYEFVKRCPFDKLHDREDFKAIFLKR